MTIYIPHAPHSEATVVNGDHGAEQVHYDRCIELGCWNQRDWSIVARATTVPSHRCIDCQDEFARRPVSQMKAYHRVRQLTRQEQVPSKVMLQMFRDHYSGYCQFCGTDLDGHGNMQVAFLIEGTQHFRWYGWICKSCRNVVWNNSEVRETFKPMARYYMYMWLQDGTMDAWEHGQQVHRKDYVYRTKNN